MGKVRCVLHSHQLNGSIGEVGGGGEGQALVCLDEAQGMEGGGLWAYANKVADGL